MEENKRNVETAEMSQKKEPDNAEKKPETKSPETESPETEGSETKSSETESFEAESPETEISDGVEVLYKRKGEEQEVTTLRECLADESGIGVVEIILILVILIGLVVIFKSQITSIVETIFEAITSGVSEVVE